MRIDITSTSVLLIKIPKILPGTLIEMYKILTDKVNIRTEQFLKLSSTLLRGHSPKLFKPFVSRRCRKEFLPLLVANEWN